MKRYLPVLTLFILSPFVAEVLFGSTPLSNLGGLIAVAPLYGGGVILVRELARRRGPGWNRIFLLGAAYGILEEGLAIQSMFNPDLFNAGSLGGRALGVNWVWSLWTVGYHIVWSISLPILLTELLFPARRHETWLGRTGLIVFGVLYALGLLAIAAIYRFVLTPNFATPVLLNILAALAAILLIVLALAKPAAAVEAPALKPAANAPSPWFIAVLAFLMAALWFVLLDLPPFLRRGAWVLIPILVELGLLAGFASLIRQWASSPAWSDLHTLALAAGPLIVNTLDGIFFVTAGNRLNQMGVAFFALIAVALLTFLTRRLQDRGRQASAS